MAPRARLVLAAAAAIAIGVAAACVPDYSFSNEDAGADAAADVSNGPRDGATDGARVDAGDAVPQDGGADAPPAVRPLGVLAAGGNDNCLLVDGGVFCWGSANDYGALGTGNDGGTIPRPRAIDTQPFGPADEVRLAAADEYDRGHEFACARKGGDVWCWGYGEYDQLGCGSEGNCDSGATPVPITFVSSVQQIAMGEYHVCARTDPQAALGSNVYCWGWSGGDATGPRDGHHLVGVPIADDLAAGGMSTCLIAHGTGQVVCWGQSVAYRAGVETTDADAPSPSCHDPNDCSPRTIDLSGVAGTPVQLAMGEYHTCVRTDLGSVWCWGRDREGELGAAIAPNEPCPFSAAGYNPGECTKTPQKAIASGAAWIVAGLFHTCALMQDRTVKCWGSNYHGKIGGYTLHDTETTPIAVVDPDHLSDVPPPPMVVDDLAVGGDHGCALRAGKIYCWGDPVFEQDAGYVNYPQLVPFP